MKKKYLKDKPFVITPSATISKQYPPAIKQFFNGVYNFNNNYIKNIPAADIIVNKIIKSFFTLNPLASNPGGKKSKLLKRRYKRLSLNRILVGKPEIKHNNDKVVITVYVFNKKKRSLMYKLNQLYENISYKRNIGYISNITNNNLKTLPSTFSDPKSDKLPIKTSITNSNQNGGIINNFTGNLSKSKNTSSKLIPIKKSARNIRLKRRYLYKRYKRYIKKTRLLFNYRNKKKLVKLHNIKFNNRRPIILKKRFYSRTNLLVKAKKRFYNYKTLNILTRRKMYNFFNKFAFITKGTVINSNLKLLPLRKKVINNYYYNLNRYKLYKRPNNINNTNLMPFKSFVNLENPFFNSNVLNTSNLYNTLKFRSNTSLYGKFDLVSSNLPIINKLDKINKSSGLAKSTVSGLKISKGKLLMSMNKIKVLYKLFTVYDNYKHINIPNSKSLNNLSFYSSKIIWNTYKLLKITDKTNNSNNTLLKTSGISVTNNINSPLNLYRNKNSKLARRLFKRLTPLKIDPLIKTYVKRFTLSVKVKGKIYSFRKINLKKLRSIIEPKGSILSLKSINLKSIIRISGLKGKILSFKMLHIKRYIVNTKIKGKVSSYKTTISRFKNIRKNIILYDELNKIDRFIKKYETNLKASLIDKQYDENNVTDNFSNYINHISNLYKLKYIKEFLDKEFVYLYYIKMLSFNNTLFKSWFLNPLAGIISKIYNKKVTFNVINLKYLHLNSDILTQAIAIKLRNFKKNRLNKVLKKVLRLVAVSKVNIYACDINSPIYKYVEQHFNKFRSLNINIFKEMMELPSKNNNVKVLSPYSGVNTIPLKVSPIGWLNHIQTSTINLIKYRSIFGIRLEASGRLTKRSTASRAIFKIKHKGSLRNNSVISRINSTSMIKNQTISNVQFTRISSKTRNGSFGLKGWVSNN